MNLANVMPIALTALLRNKTRSFLTTLGVIIGVASVISMVAVGEGAKARVSGVFAAMGTNMLIVLSGTTTTGGVAGGFGSMPTLTWEDLSAIRTQAPAVRWAAPGQMGKVTIMAQDQNWTTSLTGSSPEFFDIRNWTIGKGSLFADSDVQGASKVIVLGATVSDKLFGEGADPVGKTVRIRSVPFLVVGLLQRKGQSPMGTDYDDAAFIPITTFQNQIQGGLQKYISGIILVSAVSSDDTHRAQAEITSLLRDRHHLGPNDDEDFSIRNLTELANAQQSGTQALTALLAAIAVVSLVVGGIGIMNIMLVSVTERTREIGVRMAVGAKPWHILAQFLAEAVTLSMLGGIMGVVIGSVIARVVAARLGWSYSARVDMILVSFGFSALVGVGFGLYPARKASRLDPIEALRYE
ncbi:MAG TPA: ABC transporter permease [Polyangiaceae bacterium]|nr:ABC transporter permease [Polyangiaceae bacterium]